MSRWENVRSNDRDTATGPVWLAPLMVACLAAAIFMIDTYSPLDMAIAVLYVLIVLFSANFLERRGLLAVGAACFALTLASYIISHGHSYDVAATMRCGVSIAAITVATLLTLKNQQATHALREQAALLDLTRDAIFVRDTSDVIRYWNQGAQEIYGWTAEEAMGRKAAELLATVFPSSPVEIQRQLDRTGRWHGELRHTRRDGTEVVAMSRWALQRDDRGRAMAVMETNSDITERKRTEDALHEAQSELAHVTRITTLGELTASIAHEVNQPLAAIITNGEACLRWLGRAVPDIGEATATVQRMISNGRRASEVVARLRALARRGDQKHGWTEVNELVDDTLLLLEREIATHKVALTLGLGTGLPSLMCDRVQLQQVLINLALNAMQAMESVDETRRGLSITTRTAQDEDGPHVVIEVADTGPGVPPEQLALLFNAFYSTKAEGMGMGLSISRSIVEAHGGRINAAPGGDGGLAFTLYLPLNRETAA
ncbi:hypothetical protein GCM10007301_03570 [Azorhizobium oxalatiphilum]|uniref:histidine kinase n=1 Tax=Azorhizobium oxalatiphilum TaxID=980631 RepID=A0A917BIX4_9HYPH|nr:ATP-binding protein [Azorhizobium oxalatiphilum]GGF47533.1 hypothetical protein GCM10007301_03570 [Azorhizobium oxalatiphilum]